MRDITLAETHDFKFTTRAFATGIPTTLAGTPVISAYEDNSVTQITAGITLTADFDSVSGLNNVRVVATGANGFEAGKTYALVITTGTVGGVSVVGEVIAEFSLGRSAAAVDLANGTDGLGAIKAETALIVADTNELQTDDVPGLISTLDAVVDTVKAETALIVADTNELQTDDVPGLIATLDTVVDTVKAETALIVADTNELQTDWANAGRLDAILDVIAADTTTDIPALIAALDVVVDTVKAETALIVADTNELQTDDVPGLIATLDAVVDTVKAETALIVADTNELQTDNIPGLIAALPTLAAIIAGVWDEVLSAATHNVAASAGKRLRLASEIVQVDSAIDDPGAAATTTVFNTDLTEPDNHWNDALVVFTSGILLGQSSPVLSYNNLNGQVTLDEALTSIPGDNVTFAMRSDHIHPVTQIQAAFAAELDTAIAELGVAAPTATPTLRTGLMLLYMALRNETIVQTSGTDALEIHNDAGTLIAQKLLTDDGADLTEAKMTSG